VLLSLLARGRTNFAIAETLGVSERTVRRRTLSVCEKIGVSTPIEAVVEAVRRGLL
jgi:DNA-binding NarL/FixJ family response regulator